MNNNKRGEERTGVRPADTTARCIMKNAHNDVAHGNAPLTSQCITSRDGAFPTVTMEIMTSQKVIVRECHDYIDQIGQLERQELLEGGRIWPKIDKDSE